MSEFAFALNGEPFDVPPAVTGWRVKRLKASGPPQVVYSTEGGSLTLPIDATMEDLRREAVAEGKYRLEPVGADNHVIANAPVGYVYVHKQERSGESQAIAPAQATSNPILEAMRLNSELAKTVIDRFPVIVDSMAGLVRSVGGVDLPTRAINSLLGAFTDVADDGEDVDHDADDDDNDEVAPKATGWAGVAEKYAPQVLAALRALIENGVIKIPGGSGALLDCRLASAAGARDAAANVQGAQPAPGPRDPAPARGGGSGHSEPSTAPVAAPGSITSSKTGSAATPSPRAPSPPAALATDLPTIDPPVMAHLAAIHEGLSLEEQMLAQALMAKLSPAEVRSWLAELKSLSIIDAIAEVRAILGTEPPASTATTTPTAPSAPAGGAS